MSRTLTVPAGLAAATLALFALTGCGSAESGTTTTPAPVSSGPVDETETEATDEATAGDQSVADACSLVQTELTEVSGQINDATSELTEAAASGDTSGARELFSEVGTQIDEISSQITNADVSTAFDSYASAWNDFEALFADMTDAIDAGDDAAIQESATALSESSTGFIEASEELGTVCTG